MAVIMLSHLLFPLKPKRLINHQSHSTHSVRACVCGWVGVRGGGVGGFFRYSKGKGVLCNPLLPPSSGLSLLIHVHCRAKIMPLYVHCYVERINGMMNSQWKKILLLKIEKSATNSSFPKATKGRLNTL